MKVDLGEFSNKESNIKTVKVTFHLPVRKRIKMFLPERNKTPLSACKRKSLIFSWCVQASYS